MFARIAQYRLDARLKAAYEKHQHLLVPGLLLGGFLVDVVTFRSLRLRSAFLLLGAHVIMVTAAILYANLYDDAKAPPTGRVFSYLRFLAPLAQQFSLGALLSASLLFYWFSGALSASWPVMILLVVLAASNEVFRHVFLRPAVQIGVYAFVLLSYFSMLIPYALRSLSPTVFVLGCLSGTAVAVGIAAVTSRSSSSWRKESAKRATVVVAVFAAFTGLYFLNVIPPVPLAIREAGIFHDVQKRGSAYVLIGDEETLPERLWPGRTIRADADGRIYAFAAVFAPAELETEIFHRWQRYDAEAREWIDAGRFSYVIRGGRDEGYRGYTFKSNLAPGKWRVIVETARGQALGRLPFTVEN